ncbi:hypothetical protein J560_4439, partial [Acinetobacter baumannii 855125]
MHSYPCFTALLSLRANHHKTTAPQIAAEKNEMSMVM